MNSNTFNTALISFSAGMCLSTWLDGAWDFTASCLLASTLFLLAVMFLPPRPVDASRQ